MVPGYQGVVPGYLDLVPGSLGLIPRSLGLVPGSLGLVPRFGTRYHKCLGWLLSQRSQVEEKTVDKGSLAN